MTISRATHRVRALIYGGGILGQQGHWTQPMLDFGRGRPPAENAHERVVGCSVRLAWWWYRTIPSGQPAIGPRRKRSA